MRVPRVAFFPFHSKRSGLSSPEEPETNSIIVPSGKISPALIMRFGAFDPSFTLGYAFVSKATSSLAQRLCTKTHARLATAKMHVSQKQEGNICIPVRSPAFMRTRSTDLRVKWQRVRPFRRTLDTQNAHSSCIKRSVQI